MAAASSSGVPAGSAAAAATTTPALPLTFQLFSEKAVSEALLAECSTLFGNHYGTWSETSARAGRRVNMSPKMMRGQLLFSDSCSVVCCYQKTELVGHAFFVRFKVDGPGDGVWITQLVVHTAHQRKGIAQQMLVTALGPRRGYAFAGLVSSHPAAVHTLEIATDATCDVARIRSNASTILAAIPVPYLQRYTLETSSCVINTHFDVDHSQVLALLADWKARRGWTLGDLPEGHEFFAVCFTKPASPNSTPMAGAASASSALSQGSSP